MKEDLLTSSCQQSFLQTFFSNFNEHAQILYVHNGAWISSDYPYRWPSHIYFQYVLSNIKKHQWRFEDDQDKMVRYIWTTKGDVWGYRIPKMMLYQCAPNRRWILNIVQHSGATRSVHLSKKTRLFVIRFQMQCLLKEEKNYRKTRSIWNYDYEMFVLQTHIWKHVCTYSCIVSSFN